VQGGLPQCVGDGKGPSISLGSVNAMNPQFFMFCVWRKGREMR